MAVAIAVLALIERVTSSHSITSSASTTATTTTDRHPESKIMAAIAEFRGFTATVFVNYCC